MIKMIKCDNKASVGNNYVGVVSNFSYNGNIFLFSNMYSSTVKSIERMENILVVKTKNTEYTFSYIEFE